MATVSRALRGLPTVAEATRRRVRLAADQLKYRPDPAASRLAARKTKTITVGVPHVSGWYFSTVVAGAEAVCNEAGYEFQVIAVGTLDDRDRLLDDDHHLERRTDGLILVDVQPSDVQARALAGRGVALATVGNSLPGIPAVRIDDVEVGRLAAQHLLGLGHRRIGVIDGVDGHDPMNFTVPHLRRRGFCAVLGEHGLDVDDELFAGGNFNLAGGRDAMDRLLALDEPPTAVFAMSDEMAFGAIMRLAEDGLHVGADLSIIGVDDHEFSQVVGLTTIHQDVADHGATAARLLIEAMTADPLDETPAAPRHVEPRVRLVERTSTATP